MLLITGATGLVGSFTARRFLEKEARIRALVRPGSDRRLLRDVQDRIEWIEGDLLDVAALETALEGVSQVIHAAAVVSFAPREREAMYRTNVQGTANVVNACLQAGVEKLLFVSSVAALGRSTKTHETPVVITEAARWEESPLNSHYAKTKYLAELEVWRGVAEGLAALVVNPSVVLGAGDWQRSSTQLFKYAHDEHRFYPAGALSYVDVLDVAEAIFRLLEADIAGERFILNAGSLPYRDFLAKTALAFGKKPPSVLLPKAATQLLWPLEALRAWFSGKPPLITRETARAASHAFRYPNEKIRQATGLTFRPANETIGRVAAAFQQQL